MINSRPARADVTNVQPQSATPNSTEVVKMEKKVLEEFEIQQWLESRTEAGLKIDPETAEVDWEYGQVMDPYRVYSDLPEECQQVGRQYFARSPGSDIWVHFRDLPDETRHALWEKHKCRRRLTSKAVFESALCKT